MHPSLEEGDLVVTEKLNSMADVGEGALVVLITRKDILISRLFSSLQFSSGHVVKYDNEHYRDQKISNEEVREVWQVKSKTTSSFVHSSHLQSERLKRLEREMSRMKKQFDQLSR